MAEALTWENYERAERDIFSLASLKKGCIERFNVKVGNYKGQNINMRTIVCRHTLEETPGLKPNIVWVHGYGG